ncbi:hypothetical protein AKO1_010241 [Acrasis kona]|uniref:MORN repeat-containing protein 3 n=1 Tax=Acrasis kona TaxID=1008807 RepID=A0AAW2ZQR1_9EUKA
MKDGKPHGKGVLTYPSQHVYDGEWFEGRSHGRGTFFGTNQLGAFRYDGTFLDDEMSGRGKFSWSNGDTFEGDWSHDMPNGSGIYKWKSNGAVYTGQMKDGKRHGKGTQTFSDGSKYDGEWRQDTKCGKGVELFSNSNRYEGFWLRNVRHGPGLYQLHMSNLPPVKEEPQDTKLSKLLKRMSLKRVASAPAELTSTKKTPPIQSGKFIEYIPYYQYWENGKRRENKELHAHDDPPSFEPPVEVALECGYSLEVK